MHTGSSCRPLLKRQFGHSRRCRGGRHDRLARRDEWWHCSTHPQADPRRCDVPPRQVVLSMQLSFAVFPLAMLTGDRRKMGEFTNSAWVKPLAWAVAFLIAG